MSINTRKIRNKTYKGVSLIVFSMGIVTIFAFASFVTDFGIVINTQNELQKAVESTVLVGITNVEPSIDVSGNISIDTSQMNTLMINTFTQIINSNSAISNAIIPTPSSPTTDAQIDFKPSSKAVMMKSSVDVNTFFAQLIGIKTIRVQAQAASISAPFYLSVNFPMGVDPGSVIKGTSGDTDLRNPTGDNNNQNGNNIIDNIYGFPDNKGVCLGPGGYVTIRFPVPLEDGTGADLYIRTLGNLKGYYIFAGVDNNPANPYVNEIAPGSGIKWQNISCTGISVDADNSSGQVGAYFTTVNYNGGTSANEAKFYGSSFFDLGTKCTDASGNVYYNANVKSATYLKIIDDNVEDGFLRSDATKPVLLLGDHSSITPGVCIDSVGVLHHSRLISVKDYNTDADGDGLIDILEQIIGTNPNNSDTNGNGISDALEYLGWQNQASPSTIINSGSKNIYMSNPVSKENKYNEIFLYN